MDGDNNIFNVHGISAVDIQEVMTNPKKFHKTRPHITGTPILMMLEEDGEGILTPSTKTPPLAGYMPTWKNVYVQYISSHE